MVGPILLALGGIVALVGGIWFLVVAFKESILWGLGCLLVPFVSLVFLILHFKQAARPFLVQIVGLVVLVAGVALGPPPTDAPALPPVAAPDTSAIE